VKIFRIAYPSLTMGGGEVRSYNVLKFLGKKAEITLVPPTFTICGKSEETIEETVRWSSKLNIYVPEEVINFAKECRRYPTNPLSEVKLEIKYYSKFLKEAKSADVIFNDYILYSPVKAMSILKEKTATRSVLLSQIANFKFVKSLRWNIKVTGLSLSTLKIYFGNLYTSGLLKKFMESSKNIDLLLGVSTSSIIDFINAKLIREDIPWKVLKPANAFERELLNYSTLDKEDYAVFFARLVPDKGIFDLPAIWKKVREKMPKAKLVVIGKFGDEKIKRKFLSMTKDIGIEYKGFLPRDELLRTVAKAKVFVYPTYSDSFSLVMLESLALKTPVVVYDIPPIREIYGNLKAVNLVKNFDFNEMAQKVIETYSRDPEEMFDNNYKKFVEFYSSWEKVADAEYQTLREFTGKGLK